MTVLNVTGLKEEAVVQPGEDGTYAESRGGTETSFGYMTLGTTPSHST
jgi:hypothetical protein